MFRKKMMVSISKSEKDPLGMSSIRKQLGKKVFSKSGDRVGVISDVRYTKDKVEGFVVQRRIKKVFIGREFLSGTSKEGIVLSIDPVTLLIGKKVFDADGKKLGKVSRVERTGSSNELKALVVKKHFFSRGISVPKSHIDVSKKNIILKVAYE